MQQRKGESLRQYVQRFCHCRYTIPKISGESVCIAFRRGVRDEKMAEKLATREITSPKDLFALADKCAKAAEARGRQQGLPDLPEADGAGPSSSRKEGGGKKGKRKVAAVQTVAATEPSTHKPRRDDRPGKKKRKGAAQYCPIHDSTAHGLEECRVVKGIVEKREHQRRAPRDDRDKDSGDEPAGLGFQHPEQTIATLHGGASSQPSRRQLKLLRREVCASTPAFGKGQELKWSDTPITFTRADHPASTAGVGRLPLVVTPTIHNLRVARVLVDGGSGLNLLCPTVFDAMQIPKGELRPSRPFFGISPGASVPRGQIGLAVTFGDPSHYRTEKVVFDVADFDLPYNAILGRPALAKFMAVAHYAYMVVKLLGPKGTLTVPVDREGAMKCAELTHKVEAAAAECPEHAPEPEGSRARARITASDAAPVKEVPLGDGPTRTVKIGGSLDPK